MSEREKAKGGGGRGKGLRGIPARRFVGKEVNLLPMVFGKYLWIFRFWRRPRPHKIFACTPGKIRISGNFLAGAAIGGAGGGRTHLRPYRPLFTGRPTPGKNLRIATRDSAPGFAFPGSAGGALQSPRLPAQSPDAGPRRHRYRVDRYRRDRLHRRQRLRQATAVKSQGRHDMLERLKERIAVRIAWALPRRLVMWCYIRVGAHATTGQWGHESPCDTKMMDALQRWDTPHEPQPPATDFLPAEFTA